MNIIFFDSPALRTHLLPFTFLRPVAEIRVGILTIKDKFKRHFENHSIENTYSFLTQKYLRAKYPILHDTENYYINGAALPTSAFLNSVAEFEKEKAIFSGQELIAVRTTKKFKDIEEFYEYAFSLPKEQILVNYIKRTWDIFLQNRQEIEKDFAVVTYNKVSAPINDRHTVVYGEQHVFLEEGAKVYASILNGEKGKIYIGKDATVEEGCIIRGAFALGQGATLNTGAKMRGDTTIGKYCKVGGEVSNSVFFAYSNKAHDGFIGNAVIAEWCNLGAATNCSNLKNNYGTVRVWNYAEENYEKTDLQFCGLLMGDHSKSGINTMFNTGTVVGVGANVFGEGFPSKFIPSFAWGDKEKFVTTHLDALYKTAERMTERRNVAFSEVDKKILKHIFDETDNFRFWESKPIFS